MVSATYSKAYTATWEGYHPGHSCPCSLVCQRLDGRLELSRNSRNCSHFLRKVSIPQHTHAFDLSITHTQLLPYSVLPGIAFSLDLIETTQQYGVAEVLISSFMAAFIFSVFGGQPLTIAGVTGCASHSLSTNFPKPLTCCRNRANHGVQQDNLRHHRTRTRCTELSSLHRLGLLVGSHHPLGHRNSELSVHLYVSKRQLTDYVYIRVQFLEICDPLFVRHLRILRLMGLPPIWNSSSHSRHARIRSWPHECWCLGCYHPRHSDAGRVFPLPIVIPEVPIP